MKKNLFLNSSLIIILTTNNITASTDFSTYSDRNMKLFESLENQSGDPIENPPYQDQYYLESCLNDLYKNDNTTEEDVEVFKRNMFCFFDDLCGRNSAEFKKMLSIINTNQKMYCINEKIQHKISYIFLDYLKLNFKCIYKHGFKNYQEIKQLLDLYRKDSVQFLTNDNVAKLTFVDLVRLTCYIKYKLGYTYEYPTEFYLISTKLHNLRSGFKNYEEIKLFLNDFDIDALPFLTNISLSKLKFIDLVSLTGYIKKNFENSDETQRILSIIRDSLLKIKCCFKNYQEPCQLVETFNVDALQFFAHDTLSKLNFVDLIHLACYIKNVFSYNAQNALNVIFNRLSQISGKFKNVDVIKKFLYNFHEQALPFLTNTSLSKLKFYELLNLACYAKENLGDQSQILFNIIWTRLSILQAQKCSFNNFFGQDYNIPDPKYPELPPAPNFYFDRLIYLALDVKEKFGDQLPQNLKIFDAILNQLIKLNEPCPPYLVSQILDLYDVEALQFFQQDSFLCYRVQDLINIAGKVFSFAKDTNDEHITHHVHRVLELIWNQLNKFKNSPDEFLSTTYTWVYPIIYAYRDKALAFINEQYLEKSPSSELKKMYNLLMEHDDLATTKCMCVLDTIIKNKIKSES